jgi:hypothetical protein
MENILVILALYAALALLLGGLARLFGTIVDFAAWLIDGMPARKPPTVGRSAPATPQFTPIPLARVSG